jgi:hypothetical protein
VPTRKDLDELLDAIDSDGKYMPRKIKSNRVTDYVDLELRSWGESEYTEKTITWRNIRRIKKIASAIEYDLPEWFREMIQDRRLIAKRQRKYTNGRETITIDADFSQASCQISAKYDDGEWFSTPFQVADARHNRLVACRLVANWNG